MTRKTAEEWSEIEAVYRSGTLKNSSIARKFGISESTLRSRIKAGKWEIKNREKIAKKLPPTRKIAKKSRNPRNGACSPSDVTNKCVPQDLRADIQNEIANTLRALAATDDQDTIKALKAKCDSLKALAQTFEITTGKGAEAPHKMGVKDVRQADAEKLVSSGEFAPMKPPESFAYVRTKRKETQH